MRFVKHSPITALGRRAGSILTMPGNNGDNVNQPSGESISFRVRDSRVRYSGGP